MQGTQGIRAEQSQVGHVLKATCLYTPSFVDLYEEFASGGMREGCEIWQIGFMAKARHPAF